MNPLHVLMYSVVVWTMGAMPASAQSVKYFCRDDNSGRQIELRTPCPASMRTITVSADPVDRSASSRSSYGAGSGRIGSLAPDEPAHYQYMSARCRSLQENFRSARTRGISAEALDGMRREYSRDCRDEESAASSRYYREQREAQQNKRVTEREELIADQRARQEDAKKTQQCDESRRILASKKARTDLTPGELNDLRRFESNIIQRCGER